MHASYGTFQNTLCSSDNLHVFGIINRLTLTSLIPPQKTVVERLIVLRLEKKYLRSCDKTSAFGRILLVLL